MSIIDDIWEVWDSGSISPASLSGEDIDRFKQETGAKRVVGTKWKYCGIEYEVPYYVRILKDRTGVVHFDGGDLRTGRLVVLNGDGTNRITISVPRIDANSRPEDGYLNLPPSSARFGCIEWGCEGSDGYTDYLFEFDWRTGALLRYARPSRPW
jgi:hypothetical protein